MQLLLKTTFKSNEYWTETDYGVWTVPDTQIPLIRAAIDASRAFLLAQATVLGQGKFAAGNVHLEILGHLILCDDNEAGALAALFPEDDDNPPPLRMPSEWSLPDDCATYRRNQSSNLCIAHGDQWLRTTASHSFDYVELDAAGDWLIPAAVDHGPNLGHI